jgi:hypothetical protein
MVTEDLTYNNQLYGFRFYINNFWFYIKEARVIELVFANDVTRNIKEYTIT